MDRCLAVWPQESLLTSLGLSFLIFKMGIKIPGLAYHRGLWSDEVRPGGASRGRGPGKQRTPGLWQGQASASGPAGNRLLRVGWTWAENLAVSRASVGPRSLAYGIGLR